MAMRPLDRLPSIRAKLGSVIVFAVAVTIVIMYAAMGFALRAYERDRQYNQLVEATKLAASTGFDSRGRPTNQMLEAVAKAPRFVAVVNVSGERVLGELHVPDSVNRVLAGREDSGSEGDIRYYGTPIVRQDVVIGAIYGAQRVAGPGFVGAVKDTVSFLQRVWWQFLVAGLVAAAIALFLARILARGMTQPLRDMARAARGMARGDYSQRVQVSSRDEVGQLAEAFNKMAAGMEGLERMRRGLVADVSHELKTPISALRAQLENLLDGVAEPNPATLAVMLHQTERLSRLIEQLLDLSRFEAGDLPLQTEPVTLRPLVERVIGELDIARAEQTFDVRNEVPPDFVPVRADRERLHQVLFNLLDNAYRFTPPGGVIRVRAAHREGWCEVSVEDTGPGIPPEHLPLVFERFYRVDPSRARDGGGGTGIGLAIARSVIEAHGGRIWAENREDGGARFRFLLPAAGDDAPEELDQPTVTAAAREREMTSA
jgi:signal transduction histidine kinase